MSVPIYADFGLLSHPSLVLQAYGVRLLPGYLAVATQVPSFYENVELDVDHGDVDHGSDPINRIAAESAVFENELLRVVSDREPIVDGHLLVVARASAQGFADAPKVCDSLLSALNTDDVIRRHTGGEWFFYERGRARFCTSGFTGIHAHGHILPLKSLKPLTVEEMVIETDATKCASLTDAWAQARISEGEYLVFGTSAGDAFVVHRGHRSADKRFLRNFLGSKMGWSS
jgi:diadenosine tetraphosphate (Ap4A) HIT family hydrolase